MLKRLDILLFKDLYLQKGEVKESRLRLQCSHNGKEINILILEIALEYKMMFQLNNRDFLEGKTAKKNSKRRINGDGQSRDCTTIHHSSTVEIHKNQQTYLGNYRLLTIEYHTFFLGVFFLISNSNSRCVLLPTRENSSFERHASLAFQPPSPTKGTPSTDTRYSNSTNERTVAHH